MEERKIPQKKFYNTGIGMVEHLPNYLKVKASNLVAVTVNERKGQNCNKGHQR
jgi:hypothetical protein